MVSNQFLALAAATPNYDFENYGQRHSTSERTASARTGLWKRLLGLFFG